MSCIISSSIIVDSQKLELEGIRLALEWILKKHICGGRENIGMAHKLALCYSLVVILAKIIASMKTLTWNNVLGAR